MTVVMDAFAHAHSKITIVHIMIPARYCVSFGTRCHYDVMVFTDLWKMAVFSRSKYMCGGQLGPSGGFVILPLDHGESLRVRG